LHWRRREEGETYQRRPGEKERERGEKGGNPCPPQKNFTSRPLQRRKGIRKKKKEKKEGGRSRLYVIPSSFRRPRREKEGGKSLGKKRKGGEKRGKKEEKKGEGYANPLTFHCRLAVIRRSGEEGEDRREIGGKKKKGKGEDAEGGQDLGFQLPMSRSRPP